MKALIKVQAALKAPKSQFNAFGKYKYRNQEDILEALKPLLDEHGLLLTLTDEVKEICEVLFIEATATITDGKETIVVKSQAGLDINKKGMDKAQCFGSSGSYARKYALNAMFLIDDTKDSDATNDHKPKKKAKPELTPERFLKAIEAVKSGDFSPEELKAKYSLKEVQIAKLNELV
jgi:hypothetical protein